MRFKTLFLGLFLACAASSTWAKEVRFPEAGTPAIGLTIPDGWVTRVEGGKKFVATSADGAIIFTASLPVYDGDALDALAVETATAAKASEPANAQDITLAGFDGMSYYSHLTAKPDMVYRILAVKLDENQVALITMSMSEKIDIEKSWAAEGIIRTIRLAQAAR